MATTTRALLLECNKRFNTASLPLWVFGGWAEELRQIVPGRIHNDIDFLYPATTFEHLDRFMAQANDFQEITDKRFSHKRAMLYQDVMIEFVLVQGNDESYFTEFSRADIVWRGPLMYLVTAQVFLNAIFQ